MANIINNLVEYAGLADFLPSLPSLCSFKQLTVTGTACIPQAKPDMEQIIKVIAEIVITNTRVIRTPIGKSLEGQILTGKKLIIEGLVREKLEYVAALPEQAVHAAHFELPFSTFIVLPADFVMGTPIAVASYIEDIYVKQVSSREVFKNISLLLVAE